MCKAVYACRNGFRRVFGNGCSTKIMDDNWVEGKPLKIKCGSSLVHSNLHHVGDLIDANTNKWNSALIWRVFKAESTNRILGTHISENRNREDEIVWSRNGAGKINSKGAYSLLVEGFK